MARMLLQVRVAMWAEKIRPAGWLALSLLWGACGTDPEQALVGRWTEVGWHYERLDLPVAGGVAHRDPRGHARPKGRIVHHEAESWQFASNRRLRLYKSDGSVVEAHWRLKGRGHVLEIRGPAEDDLEMYDVKILSGSELVLHYDIGMEVQGVASLRFRRGQPSGLSEAGERHALVAEASPED